jgi:hypothetical protein
MKTVIYRASTDNSAKLRYALRGRLLPSIRPDVAPLTTARLLAGLAPAQISGIGPPGAPPTRTAFDVSPNGQLLVFVGEQDGPSRLYQDPEPARPGAHRTVHRRDRHAEPQDGVSVN